MLIETMVVCFQNKVVEVDGAKVKLQVSTCCVSLSAHLIIALHLACCGSLQRSSHLR